MCVCVSIKDHRVSQIKCERDHMSTITRYSRTRDKNLESWQAGTCNWTSHWQLVHVYGVLNRSTYLISERGCAVTGKARRTKAGLQAMEKALCPPPMPFFYATGNAKAVKCSDTCSRCCSSPNDGRSGGHLQVILHFGPCFLRSQDPYCKRPGCLPRGGDCSFHCCVWWFEHW